MKTNKIQQNKKALLAALEKSLGVVTTACKAVGIDRTTFYKYLNEDPDFATAVAELENVALDFAESSLMKQIQEGQTAATIFYLKTKGKARGYVERSEIDHTTKGEALQPFDYTKLSDAALREIIAAASGDEPGGGAR
jgi:CRP-like cAMP-binding protein